MVMTWSMTHVWLHVTCGFPVLKDTGNYSVPIICDCWLNSLLDP